MSLKLNSKTILSIFKIGIGPSSSHTLGPMLMGKNFCTELENKQLLNKTTRVKVDLYGSLSLTGAGHLTDVAVILGLGGYIPETITTKEIGMVTNQVNETSTLMLNQAVKIPFVRKQDIVFNSNFLDLHENGATITAFNNNEVILEKTYFSVGGGFIKDKENFHSSGDDGGVKLAIDFSSANELLALCKKHNKSISEIAMMRELQFYSKEDIHSYYDKIWEIMDCAIGNGLNDEGILPGGLRVHRRAKSLHERLQARENDDHKDDFFSIGWISAYALAVAEENAAGHRVVTAPTNGACAIVPAIMAYYNKFYKKLETEDVSKFLLTASAIGYLYKTNASISGAEAGCQAEIGAASSMTAVAIAEMFGASPEVACSAGEIAMEHHLGLTCDPVGGLVQIPCIERNTFGAVKAVMAAKMALTRTSTPVVSLDNVITTMLNTGKDMNAKYRETSQGGLAEVIKCPLS